MRTASGRFGIPNQIQLRAFVDQALRTCPCEPEALSQALATATDLGAGGDDGVEPGLLPVAYFVPFPRSRPGMHRRRYAEPSAIRLPPEFVAALEGLDPRARAGFERAVGGHLLGADTRRGQVYVLPYAAGQAGASGPHAAAESYLSRYGPRHTLSDVVRNMVRQALFGRALGGGKPFQKELGAYLQEPSAVAAVQAALDDPNLTVEDKVALAFMLIIKKFDKKIFAQTEKVTQLQTQGLNGGAHTSIDVEALKLSKLVTKQAQMAEILRQIVDKYNQTAKGVTDGIGR